MVNKLLSGKIFILRGVLDEVDDILRELPGYEGVRIIVLLPHGRLKYGHPSPIHHFFTLNISRVDGIYYTIIIIIELEAPILIKEIGLAFLIIFLCRDGLPIFINAGKKFLYRRRMPIYRRLIRRVPKVFF